MAPRTKLLLAMALAAIGIGIVNVVGAANVDNDDGSPAVRGDITSIVRNCGKESFVD